MSPTSSDRDGRRDARFRRAFALTVAVLFVACAVLLGIATLQGPRLQSGQVDGDAVTVSAGQQLRLFLNQRVAEVAADQVRVQPETPVRVTTTADVVAVQFDERLRYGTEYLVTVTGLHSPYLARSSTVEYRFTTGEPTLTWLDRGSPDDRIRRSTLDGQGGDVLFAAPGIQDFAVLGDLLAVVRAADRASTLQLVAEGAPGVEDVLLPEEGVIQNLDADGRVLGFLLTSADAGPGQANNRTLHTFDLDGSRRAEPVLGLDGEPIDVLGWGFLPGTGRLLALSFDQTLLLVDRIAGTVLPLGQYRSFGAVSVDGTSVIVSDQLGPVVLQLADGAERRIDPSPVEGQDAFAGFSQLLPDGARVGKALLADETGTRFASLLVRDDGATASVLYRTPQDRGSIGDFRASPNGQYLAIETVPDVAVSVSDGYVHDARSTSVTTVIVDAATGRQLRSVEGFRLQWGLGSG